MQEIEVPMSVRERYEKINVFPCFCSFGMREEGGGGELELFQIEEHCSTPAPRGQDDTTNLFFQWFTEDTVGNLQILSVLPDEHSEKVVMLQV